MAPGEQWPALYQTPVLHEHMAEKGFQLYLYLVTCPETADGLNACVTHMTPEAGKEDM